MTCYAPIQAWLKPTPTGKKSVSFKPVLGYEAARLPCMKCIGCKLKKSQEWSNRIAHEKYFYELSVFLTLTYNNQNLPKNNHLVHEHFQLFIKRLRRKMEYDHKKQNPDCTEYPKIKYYMCGEYGDQSGRAHYHAIILGVDFPDKKKHSQGKSGIWQYVSKTLDDLWGMGFCTIGSVTQESAAYTARYIMKKQYEEQKNAALHARKSITAQKKQADTPPAPYMVCSKGFGKRFYEKYGDQIHARDSVINHKGKENPVPRYYDNLLAVRDPQKLADLKEIRKAKALNNYLDNSPERLAVRGEVKKAQIKSLKRNI